MNFFHSIHVGSTNMQQLFDYFVVAVLCFTDEQNHWISLRVLCDTCISNVQCYFAGNKKYYQTSYSLACSSIYIFAICGCYAMFGLVAAM